MKTTEQLLEEYQKEVGRLNEKIDRLKQELTDEREHSRKLHLFIQKQQSELINYHYQDMKDYDN